MKLVIEKASLAADEMCVKIVGLQAVDHRSAFADAAIGILEKGNTRRVVFVRLENGAARFGGGAHAATLRGRNAFIARRGSS